MSAQSSFGELRSLLHREPSIDAWQRTCALLENWSGPDLEDVGLPYAVAHTARWPAHLCRMPRLWLDRALAGAPEPRLCVVRAIIGHISPGSQQLRNLIATTADTAIEELRITISDLNDDALIALMDAAWWPRLRGLALSNTYVSARAIEVMCARDIIPPLQLLVLSDLKQREPRMWHTLAANAPRIPALRIFGARETSMGTDALVGMAQAGLFARAEQLYLTSCQLSDDALAAIAAHAPLLDTLVIDKNPITDAAHRHLASPNLPNLRALDANGTQLRPGKLRRRFDQPGWTGF
jgi:hypothetical protein